MATTTNYGWTTPDDTALVKDGAAAIRSLGTSVDTTTKNLNPETTLGDISYRSSTANVNTRLPLGTAGQVLKVNSGATAPEWATDASGMTNPMTTTGDTIYSSSGSTPARLAIGTTGQILTVAGGVPTWATSAGGQANWSLLNSGGTSLSGSTTTISGISAQDKIMILIETASSNTASSELYIRFNSDSGSNYRQHGTFIYAPTSYAPSIVQTSDSGGNSQITIAQYAGAAGSNAAGYLLVSGCNTSGLKVYSGSGAADRGSSSSGNASLSIGGVYSGSSTISSISILTAAGTFDLGNVYVYTSA